MEVKRHHIKLINNDIHFKLVLPFKEYYIAFRKVINKEPMQKNNLMMIKISIDAMQALNLFLKELTGALALIELNEIKKRQHQSKMKE